MKKLILLLNSLLLASHCLAAEKFPDRFVWVFGWGLGKDSDLPEITRVLEQAGQSGMNGAVLSSGLDTLCQQSPDYFRRLEAIRTACKNNKLELIPAIFSVGYGGGVLSHDRNLAEGLPVFGAPFSSKTAKLGWCRLRRLECSTAGLRSMPATKRRVTNFMTSRERLALPTLR